MTEPKQSHISLIGLRNMFKRCVNDQVEGAGGRLFHRSDIKARAFRNLRMWFSAGSILQA